MQFIRWCHYVLTACTSICKYIHVHNIYIVLYTDRLGPSGKHFLTVNLLHLFMDIFPPIVKHIQGISY